MKRSIPKFRKLVNIPRWAWLALLVVAAVSGPVLAARLATVIQSSHWRQVTDFFLPLPPEQDGSIVVTLTGDKPISLTEANPDFERVDDRTFTTRFPWNWGSARTVTFTDDLGEETIVEVAPRSAGPFDPLNHDIPVLHITCDSTALWDPEIGIYTTGYYDNFLQRGSAWEHLARFEYYLPGAGKVVDQPIGLRIHGGFGRYYHQKGLRFYFDDYGFGDLLDYPFFDNGPTGFQRLIIRASRYDYAVINSNFAETLFADLGHLASRYRFIGVYLNREYWGAYSLRERLDNRFFLVTWGLGSGGWNYIKDGVTEYGSGEGFWNLLESFSSVTDPEDDQWFGWVRQNLDLASYIDWQIINMYCVSGDNGFAWNLAQFQTGDSPWRLVMWDEDLLLKAGDVNTNMFRFFTARNEEEWNLYRAPNDRRPWNAPDQRWLTMFRTLLGNGEFRALFRSRLENLLTGAMTADNLVARLDAIVAEQLPEIPGHANRWEGFQADWYDLNVDRTRQWLIDRHPVFLAQADSFYQEFSLPAWSDDYEGLVINEFLASNRTEGRDESADSDDWVEIYNGGNSTINLTGLYLTNDLTQTSKWEFPAVMLTPGERLIVWCDNELGQGPLHANFQLNAAGEAIGLFGPLAFGNAAIDTHVFGSQITDVSEGRNGDGSSSWVSYSPPSFNATNEDTSHVPGSIPAMVVLDQNYPNPFNPGTTLSYGLPSSGRVRVAVFDVRGRLVKTLVDETLPEGNHSTKWRGEDTSGRQVPSGMYIARMEFGGEVRTRSMTLVR
jgi:CotH kinase protein/Lamin Tail Domain/FlgD Ig-like domain